MDNTAFDKAKRIEQILNSPISLGASYIDTVYLVGSDNEPDTTEHRFVDTELFPENRKHRHLQTDKFPLPSGYEFVATHLAIRSNLREFLTEGQVRDFFNNSVIKYESGEKNIPDIRLASFYQPQTSTERSKYGEATTLLSPIYADAHNRLLLTFVPDKETIIKGINANRGKKFGNNVIEQGGNPPVCYIQFEFMGKLERPAER